MADIISIADKIDSKADISIIRKDTLTLKDKIIPKANSLRTHAKKDKGHWVLSYDPDTKKVKIFEYTEKGTIYTKDTILCGTEEEMKAEIKNLKLIQEEE